MSLGDITSQPSPEIAELIERGFGKYVTEDTLQQKRYMEVLSAECSHLNVAAPSTQSPGEVVETVGEITSHIARKARFLAQQLGMGRKAPGTPGIKLLSEDLVALWSGRFDTQQYTMLDDLPSLYTFTRTVDAITQITEKKLRDMYNWAIAAAQSKEGVIPDARTAEKTVLANIRTAIDDPPIGGCHTMEQCIGVILWSMINGKSPKINVDNPDLLDPLNENLSPERSEVGGAPAYLAYIATRMERVNHRAYLIRLPKNVADSMSIAGAPMAVKAEADGIRTVPIGETVEPGRHPARNIICNYAACTIELGNPNVVRELLKVNVSGSDRLIFRTPEPDLAPVFDPSFTDERLRELASTYPHVFLSGLHYIERLPDQNVQREALATMVSQLKTLSRAGAYLHFEYSPANNPERFLTPLAGFIHSIGVNEEEIVQLLPQTHAYQFEVSHENVRAMLPYAPDVEALVDKGMLLPPQKYEGMIILADTLKLERVHLHGRHADYVLLKGATEEQCARERDAILKSSHVVCNMRTDTLIGNPELTAYSPVLNSHGFAEMGIMAEILQEKHSLPTESINGFLENGFCHNPDPDGYSLVMTPNKLVQIRVQNLVGSGDLKSDIAALQSSHTKT